MPTATEQKPSDKFRKAMKQILSVSKKELNRREAEYQSGRTKEPKQKATR